MQKKIIMLGLAVILLASLALSATNTYTGTSFTISTTYADTVNEGDTLTISVTIQNTGSQSISSVTGDVASADGTTWFTGTASQSFGTISSGASTTKSYSLTASTGGSHTFTVTASGSGVTPETTSQITTHVYSKPSITSTATAPTLAYTGGDAITVSLTAYNAGELAASSANATLSYYLCTLDPGSPVNVSLGTINGGSSGSTSWVLRSPGSAGTCTAYANVTYGYSGTSYSSASSNKSVTIQALLQNITARSATLGTVGSLLLINGTGFRGEAIQVWFNSTRATYSSGNSTANADGSFSTTVIVPNVTSGTKTVRVNTTNDATGNTTAFTVYPKIALSASTGYVADSVTITGTGFRNEALQVWSNGTSLSIASGNTSVSTDGSFSSVVSVPAAVKGLYTILVNTTADATGNTSAFTVNPKITSAPSSGAVGTSVTITGKGFLGNQTLTVYFSGISAAITAGGTSTVDGNVSVTVTVPSLAYGTYNVQVNSTNDSTGYTLLSGHVVPTPGTTSGTQQTGGTGAAPALTTYRNTLASVQPGITAKLSITDTNMAVTEVAIDVKATATDVVISVTKEASLPATISIAASGSVYAYLTISVTNVDAANINTAKVKFTVPKSWVTTNSLDVSTITLNRFTTADSRWNALPTAMLSSDANNYYFEATTPGFSVFAVTGTTPAIIVPPINQTGNVTGNVTKDCRELNCSSGYECKLVNSTYACVETAAPVTPVTPPTTPPVTPPTTPVATQDYTMLLVAVVLVALAGAGAYYYFMMYNKPGKPPARPSPAKEEQPQTPAQRVAEKAKRFKKRDGGTE